jgi:uncharacterized delta-60 repeat protein
MQVVRRVSVRRVLVGDAAAAVGRRGDDFRYPIIFELLEPRLLRSMTLSDEPLPALGDPAPMGIVMDHEVDALPGPTVDNFAPLDLGDVESAVGVAVQPDGKVIVFGFVGYLRPEWASQVADRLIVARYNADGTLDASYGDEGGYSIINCPPVYAQTGGCDVLVAGDGSFWIATGSELGWLLKVSADGRTHQVVPEVRATQIALQADGKVVFAGGQKLGRLNADGSIDTTFGVNGTVALFPGEMLSESNVTIDARGRILVSGSISHPYTGNDLDPATTGVVARFNADGTSDTTFADGGTFRLATANRRHEEFSAMAVRSDGKIVVGGHLAQPVPHPLAGTIGFPDYYIAGGSLLLRLNADGTLDSSFGDGGIRAWEGNDRAQRFNDLRITADGRIVGAIYTYNSPGIAVYEANGRGDATLLGGGAPASQWPVYTTSVELAPDGSLVAVGHLSIQDRGGQIPAAKAAAHVFVSRFTLGAAAFPSDLGEPDVGPELPGGTPAEEPEPLPQEPSEASSHGGIFGGTGNDLLFLARDGTMFGDLLRVNSEDALLGVDEEDDARLPEIL